MRVYVVSVNKGKNVYYYTNYKKKKSVQAKMESDSNRNKHESS